MSGLMLSSILGLVVVAVLVWVLMRVRNADELKKIEQRLAAEAKVIDRADYVEGIEHFPVVLSLTDRELFYENHDIQAHLDLNRIEEVEYTHELATGKDVPNGTVLRLRSHGHTFEFILDKNKEQKWTAALPTHRMDEPPVGVGSRAVSH